MKPQARSSEGAEVEGEEVNNKTVYKASKAKSARMDCLIMFTSLLILRNNCIKIVFDDCDLINLPHPINYLFLINCKRVNKPPVHSL